ncbi:actin-like protein 2/3 complex subunit 3 [Microbotryum lychnidis-dioicae p1A1 Lamole]|uniref:Actin-related protein 2/3 complex subunit 3 n=2 Tax=Microbotryum TaxID=34416 RepID=U5H1F0_USTV1|nr:actin-like protein 2/3 complex subunit 3 [Microbotryum lychnidis-dioicae p1A1 Lamole]SGY68004.1 BQ5605_C004g02837 [Microbotryum silenes-dioicae]|eukprot:KDE08753.1 actin-like protein 2/3 complex subunit 3 [Microbotryum lychnidis-dioicae p1A1 Lamole]
MPAYHSSYNDEDEHRVVGNMALLPFKSRIRGPAPPPADPSRDDIIAEALDLFRANSLFRNFEIKGPADRLLIYLILFIGDCLTRITHSKPAWGQNEALKHLSNYSIETFTIPGEPGFPLNSLYAAPSNRLDADALRAYLTQARQEATMRLVERVYSDGTGRPSKWWLAFAKRHFLGKSLETRA